MRRIPFLAVMGGLFLLWGDGVAQASKAPPPTVLMISLDGTRPADLAAGRLPAVTALALRGASAERLVPSLPSNTFPNHVTLVTGVAPERHGIVDNSFVDPERGLFQKRDSPTGIQIEPLWAIVPRFSGVSSLLSTLIE